MKGYAHPILIVSVLVTILIIIFILGKISGTGDYKKIEGNVGTFLSTLIVRRVTVPTPLVTPTIIPDGYYSQANTARLAECLANQKFTMYGTEECSACKLEKSYFGESFTLVPFVDCDQYKKLCQSKNIRVYPTWENNQGVQYRGAIPLAKLAELSHCPL